MQLLNDYNTNWGMKGFLHTPIYNLTSRIHIFNYSTGSSSVWDERLIWDQEAAGSSPVYPILLADMAELADAIDLGSIGVPCGFKSHYPH